MADETDNSTKTKEEKSSQDEAKVVPIRVGDSRGRGKKHLLSGTCE